VDSAGSARPDSSPAASLMDLLELRKLAVHFPGISTGSHTVCKLAMQSSCPH